jgi:hypothetical protein
MSTLIIKFLSAYLKFLHMGQGLQGWRVKSQAAIRDEDKWRMFLQASSGEAPEGYRIDTTTLKMEIARASET